MAVTPKDFLKMNIYVPNKKSQDKFSNILISTNVKLNVEKEKLINFKRLKKGLMQDLFV